MITPQQHTESATGLKVLIAEDHKFIRKMSTQILTGSYPDVVFHETESNAGLVDLCKSQKFNLIILDVHLVDGITLTVLSAIKNMQDGAAILYFSMCPEEMFAKRVLNSGADGFLSKLADETEFLDAVNTILRGDKYISPKLQRQLAEEVINKKTAGNPFDKLSEREFEIMLLLLKGKSLVEIGNEASIQMSTVSTHKVRLFEKLKVDSLIDLNKMAVAYGITT